MADKPTPSSPREIAAWGKPGGKPVVLDYGVRPSLWQNKQFRRALRLTLLAMPLLALGWGAWYYVPPTYRQWRYLQIQKACLDHRLPEDRVVLETGPRVEQVLQQEGFFRPQRRGPGYQYRPYSASLSAAYRFEPLADLLKLPGSQLALLFCHQRVTPGGARRLVIVVGRASSQDDPRFQCLITGVTVRPADAQWGAQARWEAPGRQEWLWLQPMDTGLERGQRVRIFAGQPDPADASHFTLEVDFAGQPYRIDGWLRDPGPTPSSWSHKPWSDNPWVELRSPQLLRDAWGNPR